MPATFAAYEARIDAIRAVHPQMPRTTVVRLRLLHNVLRLLADELEQFFAGHGVSASGWSALMMIYSAPEMRANPSLLSAELVQSRTHMTRIADELVSKRLVRREPNAGDRRRVDLVLTRRGREFIERLLPGAWAHYGELLDVFDVPEAKTLERLMRKLHAHLSGVASNRGAQRPL
jgi:MarR family transcriptional repressor of emrRAB